MVETNSQDENTLVAQLEAGVASILECPLAHGNPENLITQRAIEMWLERSALFVKYFPQSSVFSEFIQDGVLDQQALYERYTTELRFLSLSMMLDCLKDFGREILETHSPQNTAFYLPTNSQSAGLMYRSLLVMYPEIEKFAQIIRGYHIAFRPGGVLQNLSDVKQSIFLDDWVLSGQQLVDNSEDCEEVGKLHTYHFIVSAAGKRLLEGNPDIFQPRYRYVLPTPVRSKGFRSQFSVYGYHKIPDYLQEYYAPGRKMCDLYSLFGAIRQDDPPLPFYVVRNLHLINHQTILQNSTNHLIERSFY